jgi:hypothetical protein
MKASLGVLGLGPAGRAMVTYVEAHPRFRLAAVCGVRSEALAAYEARSDIARYSSLDALCAAGDIDATCTFRLLSPTTASPQAARISSSRPTTRPALATRWSSTSYARAHGERCVAAAQLPYRRPQEVVKDVECRCAHRCAAEILQCGIMPPSTGYRR